MDATPILHLATSHPAPPAAAAEYITSPTLLEAFALFLEHRKAMMLSINTIRRYQTDFDRWQRWRQLGGYGERLHDITIDELRAYFTYLREEHRPQEGNPHRPTLETRGLAPATIRGIWALIHACWFFWLVEEMLTDRQQGFFVRGRLPAPRVPHEIRPTYPRQDIEALLEATRKGQNQESAARDRAAILLLFDSGMRISELCSLNDEDLDFDRRQAIITGKGNKQRYVFWTLRSTDSIRAYMAIRSGEPGGPLFRNAGRGGIALKTRGKRLTSDALRGALVRLGKRAGVELPDGAIVHALRHTFAHRFLDAGGDGLYLQQLLGHESIVTTMRYVRENPTGLRRVYQRIIGEE